MRREMLDYLTTVDDFPTGYIGAGEGWADLARIDVRAMERGERDAWRDLFTTAIRTEETSAFIPPAPWLAATRAHIDAIGPTRYVARAEAWLGRLAQADATVLCDQHELLLRMVLSGLYHCPPTARTAETVADVAVIGYTTVPAHPLGQKPKGHRPSPPHSALVHASPIWSAQRPLWPCLRFGASPHRLHRHGHKRPWPLRWPGPNIRQHGSQGPSGS